MTYEFVPYPFEAKRHPARLPALRAGLEERRQLDRLLDRLVDHARIAAHGTPED